MDRIEGLWRTFFAPVPVQTLSKASPERLLWTSIDSWLYRYVKENGQIEGSRILNASRRLPDDLLELFYTHIKRLRSLGHLVLMTDPRNPFQVFETSRAWREAGRIHSPNITWRLFWPEELPM